MWRYLWALLLLFGLLLQSKELQADKWDETYNQGRLALERGEWAEAIDNLQEALNLEPKPNERATTSSLKLVEYLPYYYLGQAYFFAGNYDLALENFQKSQQADAVHKTVYKARLGRLLEVTQRLVQLNRQPAANEAAEREFERQLAIIESHVQLDNYQQALNLLTQLRNAHPQDRALSSLEKWLLRARQRPVFQPQQTEPGNQTDELFREGLDHYLIGEYEQALQKFRSAVRLDPDFGPAKAWMSKTTSEMDRLSLEETQTTEIARDTTFIRETAEPVFALSSPAEAVSEMRSKNLTLSGRVVDDQGVDYIQVTLNGKPFLRLHPEDKNEALKFSFSEPIPLQMGENQIVLTAFDTDSSVHQALETFTVIRKPPIYQTTTFGIFIGSILLFGVGVFIATRVVKYRIAIVNKYNPYIAGSPIRNEEMFFGREKLLKRILNTLHNNSLMVYGQRRIGKTSLQHQLKRRLENLQDPEFDFIPVMIDLQGTSEERFFHTLMEEILEVCRPRLDISRSFRIREKRGAYSGRDFSRDLKELLAILSAQTDKKLKLVLLMDEVDEMNKYSEQVNQKLRSVFMKTFAESLVAVMSGAYLKKTWESEGSPWYNFFEEIEVPPFEREDAVRLICQPVAGIFSYEEKAIRKIIEYSACKPYIIQRFCINAINRIIEHKRRRVTVEDVEVVRGQVLTTTEVTEAMGISSRQEAVDRSPQ